LHIPQLVYVFPASVTNQIRNHSLALLFLALSAAAQASPDWVYATHANVSIPEGSPLIHMPSLEDETLHEFVGQVELAGKVQVGWYRWIGEDSTEIEMELMFVPAAEQHTKLPVVQHPLEPPTLPKLISLDIRNGDESAMLTRLFGEKLAADILKKRLNRSVEGIITFNTYQTRVECDRRFFRATPVSFTPTAKPKVLGSLPQLGR
jgi:uncharacterized protein involved in tolerance to divalent cations